MRGLGFVFGAATALSACASSPSSLSEERPPKSPLASRAEAQLSSMAKFSGRTKGSIILAMSQDDVRERPTVAFSFQVVPPRAETAPALREGALLAATIDADGRSMIVAVRPTTAKVTMTEEREGGEVEATYDKVQILLARKREESGSHDARLHVARVFGLDVGQLEGAYAGATLSAFVLGTKLLKSGSPPAFRSPGEGPWTLLRIVSPGEGYVAIDWDAGRGEIFPKTPGPSELATAILRAM
jgi:hypothetical protein